MTSMFGMEKREVIRIKVKKCEGMLQPDYKKMSVDPELTSFDILIRLLAKAFQIKGSFTVSYLARDDLGQDVYLSLLSDWDLDAAFLSASDPYLRLKVDLRPFEEGMEDWDCVAPTEVASGAAAAAQTRSALGLDARGGAAAAPLSFLGSLTGAVTAGVGKTARTVSKVMGLKQEETSRFHLAKPPMTDPEFRYCMDAVGHMVRPDEFRLLVYQGGVEPALRGVVWRHLLNVYPDGLSGRERFEYQRRKCNEYFRLRDEWRDLFSRGRGTEEMRFIANMVKKDVLRTDRAHKVYAGSDDSANVLSLFNILVTYALTHPDVSYCQGMSDIASPLLVVESDEAAAYLCFCGLMKRMRKNFTIDGQNMSIMFEHLALLLRHRDPDFYAYLESQGASDMLFTYRWLLLELKREFPLDDALLMLEVMWSSLPPNPPETELELADPGYSLTSLTCSPQSPSVASLSKNYLRIKSLCRQVKLRSEMEGNEENSGTSPGASAGEYAAAGHQSSHVSPSTAITPAEEMKTFDPSEFEPADDPATKELLDRGTSIDESLKVKPEPEIRSKDGVQAKSNQNQERCDVEIAKEFRSKIDETDSTSELRSSLCETKTPPGSPKRPDTITLNKTFVPNTLAKPGTEPSEAEVVVPQNCATKTSETSSEASEQLATLESRKLGTSTEEKRSVESVLSKNEDHKPPAPNASSQKNVSAAPEAPDGSASSKSQASAADSKSPSSSKESTPRKMRRTLVLTESGVTEETVILNSCEEATESGDGEEEGHPSIDFIKVQEKLPKLPSPMEFGDGNPFLMFLCLTLLVQERDHIVQNRMDSNDLAMHFVKLVRRHDVYKVLHQAQSLYAVYLRAQTMAAHSDSKEDVSV